MRRGIALGLFFALCAASTGAQEPPGPTFWKGKLQLFQFNFLYGVGVEDRSLVKRNVEVWETDYDLVQGPEGIVREELAHMNWHPSVEGPMGIRLLNYRSGVGVVFDKGGHEAMRWPLLPPAAAVPLEQRQILGFLCDGKEYDWTTTRQHARVQLQRWSARDSNFRVPLLEIEYFTKGNGELLTLSVAEVSELDAGPDVPASVFQPPSGLRVIDVPFIE
jgi:hypothetical protein